MNLCDNCSRCYYTWQGNKECLERLHVNREQCQWYIPKKEGEPDGGKKTMIFDEVIRCPLCESEAELIDVVDEHHTEVYRCKVFDDHIFYKNKEKEAKKL